MAMAMEVARVMHQERLREAEERHRRRVQRDEARQRAEDITGPRPKTEWPVFSIRIGRLYFAVFRTVRL